jgi:hypothetical protein
MGIIPNMQAHLSEEKFRKKLLSPNENSDDHNNPGFLIQLFCVLPKRCPRGERALKVDVLSPSNNLSISEK